MDVIFFSVATLTLLALGGGHLTGNILTGRAKNRFINWEWPHPHEVQFATRFMHLVHVLGMITLGLSGLYIRFPNALGIGADRNIAKYIHYIAMVIVTVNFVARVRYAFFSSNRDYKEFSFTRKDLGVLIPSMLYYGFVKPSYRHVAKYGPMQKLTYGYVFLAGMTFQIISGFYLFFAYQLAAISPILTLGMDVATLRELIRLFHYALNWTLIIFTMVHAYLSLTEDFPAFLMFFFGYRSPRTLAAMADHGDGHHAGHGEHGDAADHGHVPEAPVLEPEMATSAVAAAPVATVLEEDVPVASNSSEAESKEAFIGLVDSLHSISERLTLLEDKVTDEKKDKE